MHPSFVTVAPTARIEILDTVKLTVAHFESMQQAFEAADKMVEQRRVEVPKLAETPDKIFPGFPQLDQFWFAEFKGTWACMQMQICAVSNACISHTEPFWLKS